MSKAIMRALRSRLLWLAALTLTVQIAGMAIAPAAMCCLPGAESQASMDCCKDAGPGHICPLMKKKETGQTGSDGSLRACASPEDQIFTALLGLMGLPAPSASSLAAPQVTIGLVAATHNAFSWLAPVESPPPRA